MTVKFLMTIIRIGIFHKVWYGHHTATPDDQNAVYVASIVVYFLSKGVIGRVNQVL